MASYYKNLVTNGTPKVKKKTNNLQQSLAGTGNYIRNLLGDISPIIPKAGDVYGQFYDAKEKVRDGINDKIADGIRAGVDALPDNLQQPLEKAGGYVDNLLGGEGIEKTLSLAENIAARQLIGPIAWADRIYGIFREAGQKNAENNPSLLPNTTPDNSQGKSTPIPPVTPDYTLKGASPVGQVQTQDSSRFEKLPYIFGRDGGEIQEAPLSLPYTANLVEAGQRRDSGESGLKNVQRIKTPTETENTDSGEVSADGEPEVVRGDRSKDKITYMDYDKYVSEREWEEPANKYDADVDYAKGVKKDAYEAAEDQYRVALRDAQTNFQLAQPTYGAAAENMLSQGLAGSGYSEYLTGKAYEAKANESAAARSQMSYQKMLADQSYNDSVKGAFDERYQAEQVLNENYKAQVQNAINGIMDGIYDADVAMTLISQYAPTSGVRAEIEKALRDAETQYNKANKGTLIGALIDAVGIKNITPNLFKEYVRNAGNYSEAQIDELTSQFFDENGKFVLNTTTNTGGSDSDVILKPEEVGDTGNNTGFTPPDGYNYSLGEDDLFKCLATAAGYEKLDSNQITAIKNGATNAGLYNEGKFWFSEADSIETTIDNKTERALSDDTIAKMLGWAGLEVGEANKSAADQVFEVIRNEMNDHKIGSGELEDILKLHNESSEDLLKKEGRAALEKIINAFSGIVKSPVTFKENKGIVKDFSAGDNFTVTFGNEVYRVDSEGRASSEVVAKATNIENNSVFGYNKELYVKVDDNVYKIKARDLFYNGDYDKLWLKVYNTMLDDLKNGTFENAGTGDSGEDEAVFTPPEGYYSVGEAGVLAYLAGKVSNGKLTEDQKAAIIKGATDAGLYNEGKFYLESQALSDKEVKQMLGWAGLEAVEGGAGGNDDTETPETPETPETSEPLTVTRGAANFESDGLFNRNLKNGDNFTVEVANKSYKVESGGICTDKAVEAAAKTAKVHNGEVFVYDGEAYLMKDSQVYNINSRPLVKNGEADLISAINSNTAANVPGSDSIQANVEIYGNITKTWKALDTIQVGHMVNGKDTKYKLQIRAVLDKSSAACAAAVGQNAKDGQVFIHGRDIYLYDKENKICYKLAAVSGDRNGDYDALWNKLKVEQKPEQNTPNYNIPGGTTNGGPVIGGGGGLGQEGEDDLHTKD